VINKMATFPGIRYETSFTVHWPFNSYKSFFDAAFGHSKEMPMKKRSEDEQLRKHVMEHIQDLRGRHVFSRRHGPGSGEMESAETQALGVEPLDSILLEKEHLTHPKLAEALEASMPSGVRGQLRGNLVSGRKVHQLANESSVNPAWRRAYSRIIASADGGDSKKYPDTSPLKALGKDSGVYLNEASTNQTNWKQAFWGSNYERLSQIKTKYDPNGVFWVTPGVNADHFSVQDGRVCRVNTANRARYVNVAPVTDNPNLAMGMSYNADGPGFPFWATPKGWTLAPMSTWQGAMGGSGSK
jgi:hypothetical protein